jgi:hypothetical protein
MAAKTKHANVQYYAPDYPYPEAICDGVDGLLNPEQKGLCKRQGDAMRSFAKKVEKQSSLRTFYDKYTAYECLPTDQLRVVKEKLQANLKWEQEHGPLKFNKPPYDPIMFSYCLPRTASKTPLTPMSEEEEAWIISFNHAAAAERLSRKAQRDKWITENMYPTWKNDLIDQIIPESCPSSPK